MSVTTISLFTGLTCLFCFGIANAFVKIPCQRIEPRHFIIYKSSLTSLFLLLAIPFAIGSQAFVPSQFAFSIALAALGYIAMLIYYKAMQVGKVGIVGPVTSTNLVYTLLFSVLFLGLVITKVQLAIIAMIILAIVISRLDFKDLKSSLKNHHADGFSLAVVNSILMGTFFFLSQIPNKALGFIFFPFLIEFFQVLFGLLYLKTKGERLAKPDKNTLLIAAGISLLLSIGITSLFAGVKYGNPVIVFTLYSSSPLLITLIGAMVYKERLKKVQYAAVLSIVLGIILLRIFS